MDIIITQKGLYLLGEIDKENERMGRRLSTLDENEIMQLNLLLDKIRN